MAIKTAFFLLAFAFVILVARAHSDAKVPAHAPTPSPKKAPVHAPAHAPTKHHHIPSSKKAPAKPSVNPPLRAPIPPVSPIHDCVAICEEYCKPVSPKRPCMKVCTACCAKYKCVPVGSKKCTNWGRVMIHGAMVKCH